MSTVFEAAAVCGAGGGGCQAQDNWFSNSNPGANEGSWRCLVVVVVVVVVVVTVVTMVIYGIYGDHYGYCHCGLI